MKTFPSRLRKLTAFAFAAAFIATGAVGCHSLEGSDDPTHVKVLMIGNSFSISCLTHLPSVARACGKKLDLGSLYIGGCSLERHATNIISEMSSPRGTYNYQFVPYEGAKQIVHRARLTDALSSCKWDIITIQQASRESWEKATYHPWGDNLVRTIRARAPQAKIVVQQTWSYTPFDRRLNKWKLTPDEMYDRLTAAYDDFAKSYGFEIIPTGRAIQEWRRRLPVKYGDHSFGGDVVGGRGQKPEDQFSRNFDATWSVNSDTCHLNEKGEYFQALVWAASLLKADVSKLKSHPKCVTDDEAKLMREIAMQQ